MAMKMRLKMKNGSSRYDINRHGHMDTNTYFFYKQHFYNQRQAEIGKKIKQMLSNTLRLNFCYSEIIRILHLHFWMIIQK